VANNLSIQIAQESDAAQVLDIYKPFILETAVTFEETVPQLDDFKNRMADILKESPFLVCKINGIVAGYAYASAHRARAAYRWNREVSVYVHPGFRRKNIAKALYHALFSILKIQGFANLLGGVTLPNQASVALHESFGFTKCAEFNNIGFKLGVWQKVGWWELSLVENPDDAPTAPLLFSEIRSGNEVQECLEMAMAYLKI
jgi:phosphinothricin acetyltransferase